MANAFLRKVIPCVFLLPLLLTPGASVAQACPSEFDISKFHMQNYSDPALSYAVKSIVKMSLRNAIQGAKASGYTQESAIKAGMEQVKASEQAAATSIKSAHDFTSGSTDIEGQIKRGLPADTVCSGAAGAAMCAAQLAEWQAEVARQVVTALKCQW